MNTGKYQLYKGAWIDKSPPHLSKIISNEECIAYLKKGGLLVRNTYDFDCNEETSFWYVIKDSFDEMTELSTKVRNQVRKSLKTYNIKIVSANEMLEHGYSIFCEAIENYKVKAQLFSKESFEERIQTESKKGNVEYWMVFEKESNCPVALSINTVYKDCCEYNTMKAIPAYLRNSTYPYYGLIYEMNRYYLGGGLMYVNDGARSITEHSNIQPFLIDKFKFRKAYCKLQIKYVWWMRVFVNLLYPFRKIIPIQKVKSILQMEAMKRNQY